MEERTYKLRYLPLFEDDLSKIINYIVFKLKNHQAADNLIYNIETAIMDRLKNAESFETYQSTKDRKHPHYRIYIKNYIIYYVVICDKAEDIKTMEVRRILYNKRDKGNLI